METIDKKFTKLIRKLGCLKKFATEYQAYLVKSKNYLGLGDPDNFWLKQVQSLINEIDLMVFVELWELIKERTLPEDNFGGYVVPSGTFTVNLSRDIKYVINSREPDKVDALIQQIKKVQRRHHVKAEASGKAGKINKKILFRWYLEGFALCILFPICIKQLTGMSFKYMLGIFLLELVAGLFVYFCPQIAKVNIKKMFKSIRK